MDMVRAMAVQGDLVERCKSGDSGAWDELVNQYSNYVYAIAVRGFRLSEEDAEDVFQETFIRAFEKVGTLSDDSALQPWIAQIARRLSIDKLRSLKRELPSDEVEDAPASSVITKLNRAMDVRSAMSTLPPDCQQVLDRFFARDESYHTIGDALEIPPGTIASRISRCLSKLKAELAADYEKSPAKELAT